MKKPTKKIKGWADGILQPDWSRLEEAHYIKVDPETGEISWPPSTLEEQLKKAGLI